MTAVRSVVETPPLDPAAILELLETGAVRAAEPDPDAPNGARVHVAAGVTIGGVLEPPGARPVIVEDDAFVGAGSCLLDGVLVRRGAVIAAGVTLTATSRLYDLVRDVVIDGTSDAPLVVP